MTGPWDAERDACEAAQALAGLVALLRDSGEDGDSRDQQLKVLAENGGAAAARVVAYLREQRGAGDGAMAAVPLRLGPWRDWMPPRGHLFGASTAPRRINEVPQPRRCDPGE